VSSRETSSRILRPRLVAAVAQDVVEPSAVVDLNQGAVRRSV
jgi:hypothetical protein